MELCRLCCEMNARINIFYNGEILSKILHCCSSLNIKESDGLPSYICEKCKQDLDNCYKFLLRCEEADKKYHSGVFSAVYEVPDIKPKLENKVKSESEEDQTCEDFTNVEIKKETVDVNLKPNIKLKCKKQKYKKRKSNPEDKICSICGRKCHSPSALLVHMRSHTNDKPYQCPSCAKQYKDNGSLKVHIERYHSGNKVKKKFICETCGKDFISKSAIKIHLRIHTGETPHACPFCPKKFSQTSSLVRHKMNHTGERPHKCPTCPKRFTTKAQLKYHSITHTSEKNYSCPVCSAALKRWSSLKKHMHRKHNGPVPASVTGDEAR